MSTSTNTTATTRVGRRSTDFIGIAPGFSFRSILLGQVAEGDGIVLAAWTAFLSPI
jgi:hypothetical protein